jgi:glycosyltransferase involved in cell wall biosynthesis
MKVGQIISGTEWHPSRTYEGQRPTVSVLLPTFRRGASGLFLKAARSVLEQEVGDLELIVVDDGSTDGTADQIRDLMAEDERVHCLRHPRNVGLPAISEYEAYGKARGEYIAFAFDDDEFHPWAIGELRREARERQRAVVHGYVELYVREEGTGKIQKVGDFGRGYTPQALLRSNNYISNNSVLLHRSVLERVGLYDPHVCMARLCDWDLLRRIAEHYTVTAVEVAVGKVWGPSTTDSVGHTYLTEPWLSLEWMNRDRDERLRPDRFEDYDVLAVPEDLSREARLAIEDLIPQFRTRSWFPAPAVPPPAPTPTLPEGHILVVVASYAHSVTLCFDRVPAAYRPRVRVIHYGAWNDGLPEEMVGASAVIFVRALFHFIYWIELARRLGVPHYYFLDDNLMLLSGEKAFEKEYASYTDDNVREMLRSFSGVLLSSEALIDYFQERGLHEEMFYYPPIATPLEDYEPRPGPYKEAVRVGYLGGSHRDAAFQEQVVPAIASLAPRHRIELVVMGMPEGCLGEAVGVPVRYLPYEVSYDLALRNFSAAGVDILAHPGGDTANNRFKTLNVLINAASVGAAAVLSDRPPYDRLVSGEVALICDRDPASWAAAIERLVTDGRERARLAAAAARFCEQEFSGARNASVLASLLIRHPAPGLLVKDVRFRKAIAHYKQHPAGPPTAPGAGGPVAGAVTVPVSRRISYDVRATTPTISEVATVIGTMGRPVTGTVTLQVRDGRGGGVLREAALPIRGLVDWARMTFTFDELEETDGRELVLRFLVSTDNRIALFESSTDCKSLRRRVLRKLGIDYRGRDLVHTMR